MNIQIIKEWKCFGGTQYVYRHTSSVTGTDMDVGVFVPAHAQGDKLASLTFLSGLTCNWENFTTKAGAQRYAAEHNMILIMPDTSPRGEKIPNDEAYDLGQGAGFYVDATQEPWNANFKMWSYISEDLPKLIVEVAPVDQSRRGISGHSMGGHGALIFALREPQKYKSVSAIAPIVAPSQVPWGQKAFNTYLGDAPWSAYDACELAKTSQWKKPILIDQGLKDEFLDAQLKPELFAEACKNAGISLQLKMRDGYDHSYYFIASVIGEHIAYHAKEFKS